MLTKRHINCDLCVIGGGLAGMSAAIAAARCGLRVVLMHERPMLGGNASSEIRMWICGAQGEDNRETGIPEEIALENLYRNPTKSFAIWDTVLYDFVHREKNITLLLNCTCIDASSHEGNFAHGRTRKIDSVTGYQMTTQTFIEVSAKFFCDSSGDSITAPLCKAEFKIGREAASEYGELASAKTADSKTMGMSCLIQGRETSEKIDYIPPEWSAKLSDSDFENRMPDLGSDYENFWYLELGGGRKTEESENVRDELLSLAAGTWDYIKNSGNFNSANWDLDFLGFLPGKRESRRMCGEYMITQCDISDGVRFDDEIAYGGWPLDDHFPDGFYHRGVPNTNFTTPAPYSIPYRCLYSKNVDNLFFAGRNISATHMAMSSTRVMATCALLGEAVGTAAYLACENNLSPHGVYLDKIETLQDMLMDADCFLPNRHRKVSDACKNALLSGASDIIRNGEDRAHRIYKTTEETCAYAAENGKEISYITSDVQPTHAHIVFCSDLNRRTLPVSDCERMHSMRANKRLDSPQVHMPSTLCREFKLIGERGGVRTELLHITENRRRSYHLPINETFDKLILIPISNWGGSEKTKIVSFDF